MVQGCKILDKVCYRLSGKIELLLNGITSNELSKPTNAFLDRFGKLIVFFNQKVKEDDAYLLMEEKYEKKFLEHISKYVKLTKTKIEKIDKKIIHIIGNKEVGEIQFPQKIGYLTVVEKFPPVKEISEEEYALIRLENDIPVQGIDFDNEMFLDLGFYDSVSFTKGCYLGQEVMARVHNLSKPGRRLVRILYDKLPEKVTIKGEEVGKITTSCFSQKYKKYLAFAIIRRYEEEIDEGKIISTS